MIFRWLGFSLLYVMLALMSFHNLDTWSFCAAVWLPAPLLFATLWLSPTRDWPLWLITAALLHMLIGVYIGRPLTMAALFCIFDVVIFPLGVIIFRRGLRLLTLTFSGQPIAKALFNVLLLTLCAFSSDVLLSQCLQLAGYPVDSLHFISWLPGLTSMLTILPILHAREHPRIAWRSDLSRCQCAALIALNLLLLLALYSLPFGNLWPNLIPLLLQLTVLLLSAFYLPQAGAGMLLIAQFLVVTCATLHRSGLFYNHIPAVIPAIWQAQWYLIFSAVLVNFISRFMLHSRQHATRTESMKTLVMYFSRTGAWLMFRLEMPAKDLSWYGSIDAFFPGETTVGTLGLLEAHCETPFIDAFTQWYASHDASPFQHETQLQRLDGQQLKCLLLMQRIEGETYLNGGISLTK